MSSCPWKLKLDQSLRFRTRGPAVRAFLFSFHYAQLDRIDKRATHTHVTDNYHVRRNFSAAEIALSGPPAKSMQAGNVPQ